MSVCLRRCCLLVVALAACQPNRDGTPVGPGEPPGPGVEPSQQGNATTGVAPAGNSNAVGTNPAPGANPAPATNPNAVAQPGAVAPVAGNANLASAANYRFLGRVPETQQLTWPGTGVEASFVGTRGTATFASSGGISYVGVSVDDGNATRVQVQGNVPIAFGPVARGTHRVRIVKLNEAELGTIRLTALRADGVVTAPASPNRLIEFVGDSITLGYGIEGTRPCENSSALENVTKAFSGLTARALGADASFIAWSGHGMTRNAPGVTDAATMPQVYLRASAGDAASRYAFGQGPQPQVVVITLGTNDFTYVGGNGNRTVLDQSEFVATYLRFVQQVRANHPAALVVLAGSPMLSDTYPTAADAQHRSLLAALTAVQAQSGDANVRVLDVPTMDTTVTACDYHPSAAEHVTIANLLVAELRDALGW